MRDLLDQGALWWEEGDSSGKKGGALSLRSPSSFSSLPSSLLSFLSPSHTHSHRTCSRLAGGPAVTETAQASPFWGSQSDGGWEVEDPLRKPS